MKFFQPFNIGFTTSKMIAIICILFFLQPVIYAQTIKEAEDSARAAETITKEVLLDTIIPPDINVVTTPVPENQHEYFDLIELEDSVVTLSKQKLPDSVLKAMKEDKDFWYANHVFEKEKEKEVKVRQVTPLREKIWFKTLMWLIIIAGFAYALIAYLGSNTIGLFRRSVKGITQENEIAETENIFEINYRERIERAVRSRNYSLAVRLHFLEMLKTLAGKNMIQYKQDHTNFDYLLQLRSTSYYNDFFRLTRNYEYAWFGNFPVDEEKYSIIKNDFEKFDNGLLRK